MFAKNPKRRENEAIWDEMKRRASDADVRPTPLSPARTLSGNLRLGDLSASLNREVPRFDRLTGASATLNPAPAAAAAAAAPAAPAVAASVAPAAPTAIWMSKSDAAWTTSAAVLAPDAAAVERLKRSGYSVRGDQTAPRELEGARMSTPSAAERQAPGVYSESGQRMASPAMVSTSGADQNGRQSTWSATARDTEDVMAPARTREDQGPTPIEIQRELSAKQYKGYQDIQARLAQEDAAWIAGQENAQSIWDAQGVGTRMIDARRKKLGPLTLAEQEKIQGVKL